MVAVPRRDDVDILHGRSIPDPYRWLEDEDDPATRRWSRAQDALFAARAKRWRGRPWVRRRIQELLAFEVVAPPTWRAERRFFTRRGPDQEHPVLVVAEGDNERVLVDPVAVDPSGVTTLDAWQPSWEGDRLAIQTSVAGTEQAQLTILDVATGRRIDGPIDRVRYATVAWLPGGQAFYYVRFAAPAGLADTDPASTSPLRLRRCVFLHRLGSHPDQDVVVFDPDPAEPTRPRVGITPDGRWLGVTVNYGTGMRNDLWLADLTETARDAPAFGPAQHGQETVTGMQVGYDGRLYLLTDRNAPRTRLCVADPRRPGPAHWQELIAEDPQANLEEFALLEDPATERPQLLVVWTRHAVSELAVHDGLTGDKLAELELPGAGTADGLKTRPGRCTRAWFVYSDPTTPPAVWCYEAKRRAITAWLRTSEVAPARPVHRHDSDYPSRDGTSVHLSLLAPVAAPDTSRPTILHAYGGFGRQRRPRFTASVLAWVEAGGVYAVAHVRGGGEEGAGWHHAGIRADQQNTIDDVIAAARWLVETGWTSPEKLCLSGGSNGGLVMGAVLTQRPALCQAVIALVPLFDMVRYEHHGLGQLWTREYGSAADPEQLDWLLGISPYHHVQAGTDYPATLLAVFDNDTRVDPLHARKMCAALQWATTGHRPILLRREAEVGHSDRALSRAIELAADALSFAGHWTGLSFPRRQASAPGAPSGRDLPPGSAAADGPEGR